MDVGLTPVTLKTEYTGAPVANKVKYNPNYRIDHFNEYRNEVLSRVPNVHYEWGNVSSVYTPTPDVSVYKSTLKYNNFQKSEFSVIDRQRSKEVDDYYLMCQLHRDQYKDTSGSLHPLNYFKKADYLYQCPSDPTSAYMKHPEYYVKYRQPIVLPLTLERSLKTPMLPERALTGRYNTSSDISYKR
ncbi:uncharacterized protein LOC126887416 [Diabrotica virgifera virgifera]|uniref:Uncharacterized protein n=2 Tax=Diabrotica virgifera virgifera TaxID=50390 RepID=A0ABM5KL13_DIAVI|nr:uncharacterized protein LOC126887416 [Diabrotica virgifera virgifera]